MICALALVPNADRQEGRVHVLLEDDLTDDTTTDNSGSARELVDAKDETIRLLTQQLESERRANEENRCIIAALTSRIPELEAPVQELRESPAGEEGSYPLASRNRSRRRQPRVPGEGGFWVGGSVPLGAPWSSTCRRPWWQERPS
jgi:hypothetical protein